jgi:hypothetical protein
MYEKTIQNFILIYNNVLENVRKKRLTSNFIYTYFKTLNLSIPVFILRITASKD